MDNAIDMEGARALVGESLLWPRVRDFLWDFAPSVDSTWLEDMDGFDAISQSPSIRNDINVKHAILSHLGVGACFYAFPKEDFSRIALLDGKTLFALAQWLGAIGCADALRRETGGAKVRELKKELAGVYPDAFAFTAYFKAFTLESNPEDGARGVIKCGANVLFSLISSLDEAIVRRFSLKLPKWLGESLEETKTDAADHTATAKAVEKLLRLKFPEAYTLCCS